MGTTSFFKESREQSIIKAEIVAKYFWAWAHVIMPSAKRHSNKIAYIDLFAGPGRYKDGSKSTPLMVIEGAIQDQDMSNMLVAMFNDASPEHAKSLENEISKINGIDNLKNKPIIFNEKIGTQIAKMFESINLIPTFFFVDPWGYKGLSLRLVNSVLKDWGCDCVFFFNYTRINMGITNPLVVRHMNALFGEERADSLREVLRGLAPYDREMTIVNELAMALKELGGKFVLPFCFKSDKGVRTSHHLIFVSKNVKGYEIMKEIMARYSSESQQGVPSFQYNPVKAKNLPLLFDLSRPLDELGDMLLLDFAGKKLTMRQVYDSHHVDKPFIKKNYKDVLRKLEENDKIITDPAAGNRLKRNGKVTFADRVKVTFPREE